LDLRDLLKDEHSLSTFKIFSSDLVPALLQASPTICFYLLCALFLSMLSTCKIRVMVVALCLLRLLVCIVPIFGHFLLALSFF